jgi:meso-butanediol dehydrogenase / (S,S)-butanediol dehydrogenase / diacetyl reductase
MDLSGRVAIVTGAGRGLGAGIARSLAREQMAVVLVDLDRAGLDLLAGELEGLGGRVLPLPGDVTSAAAMADVARKTIDELGGVDLLVNNAGVLVVKGIIETNEADWDRVIDVNLKGVFLASKAVIPHMIERRSGRIVNLSSIAGLRGAAVLPVYAASKWGVLGLTQSMAAELGPYHINVNAVCPGVIETDMWTGPGKLGEVLARDMGIAANDVPCEFMRAKGLLGRPQTAADIGEAVVYLAKADNVTGAHLVVDGGITAV